MSSLGPRYGGWALRVGVDHHCVVLRPVVSLFVLSLGPRYGGWALRVGVDPRRVVLRPFVLSLRCSCRPSALHAVVGPVVPSFGRSRWPRPVVALALTPPCRHVGVGPALLSRWRWPRPVVVWPAVFILGPSMRRPARRVVLPPFTLSCGPTCYRSPGPGCLCCCDLGFRG